MSKYLPLSHTGEAKAARSYTYLSISRPGQRSALRWLGFAVGADHLLSQLINNNLTLQILQIIYKFSKQHHNSSYIEHVTENLNETQCVNIKTIACNILRKNTNKWHKCGISALILWWQFSNSWLRLVISYTI